MFVLFCFPVEKARPSFRVVNQWRHSRSGGGVTSHRGHQRSKGPGPHRSATALFPWYSGFPQGTLLSLL